MTHNNPAIKTLVDKLWSKLWTGGISNPLTAIEQITYLLFMKQLDDMDEKKMKNNTGKRKKYTSIYKNNGKLKWSFLTNNTMTPEKLLLHIQTKVFPFIKKLDGNTSLFSKHMSNAVFLIQKPNLLIDAMKLIDEIYAILKEQYHDNGTFIDAQGDVYEYLLSEIKSAGKNGQFRTPPHIIQMIVEMVFSEVNGKQFQTIKISDPACGTAGFLLAAYRHIITRFTTKNLSTDDNGFKVGTLADKMTAGMHTRLENNTFYGYDIDVSMVRIALMNLIMHGITSPNIDFADSISKSFTEENEYDIVLANPPFTGSVDKADINTNIITLADTSKSELLFIANIYRLLKKGGTAGMIVPQGVLFSNSKAFIQIRKLLLERCELKAVVNMPGGVFKPYAGVATAILIFEKKYTPDQKISQIQTKKVWFYNMKGDGYTLDDKRVEKYFPDKKRDYGDLHQVISSFKKRNSAKKNNRKGNHFFVNIKEIERNNFDLSFNTYVQEDSKVFNYDPPKNILKTINESETRIKKELADLNKMFNEI